MAYECVKCKDTGWIHSYYTVIEPAGYGIAEYSEPCDCPINRDEYEMWFGKDEAR